MRWLLLKDLQILRRSPLLVALLVLYPLVIAGLVGAAVTSGPGKPKVAFLNEVPPDANIVDLGGEKVDVTKVEFEILFQLARHPGHVFRREELLEHLWGDSAYRDLRTIDVHIRHLREKIEADPREPRFLITDRGVGYHFREG